MRKALLIGLIVSVLALGGIGAAFAAGMPGFTGVGALSLGIKDIPTINPDYIGFHLSSAMSEDVVVDGVYISLDTTIAAPNAVSVSLRDAANNELAYYAANDVSWGAGTITLVNMSGGTPTADQVFKVKVVVAQNSHYN